MRFNLRRVVNPQRAIRGLAVQAAGVVVTACANKYIPSPIANWAVAIGAAALGMWYPITVKLLAVTHLDEQINNV